MISVICVYNNKFQFDNQLKAGLERQDADYELIAIDNTKNIYKSAAEALNHGCRKAKGDILVISHQDIYLKRNDELRRIAKEIFRAEKGTIIGTQGVKEPSKVYYTNITAGNEYDDKIIDSYSERLYEVSCVDEGFFGMKKDTWEMIRFNENICDDWHLYCVELCLHTRKLGNKVYVFPSQLHHFSMGKISLKYMLNLKKLCAEYRSDFEYIWTTCYKVRTNRLYINLLFTVWFLNRVLRGKLK